MIVNCVGKIELLRESHDRTTEMDFTIPAVRGFAEKIKKSGFNGVVINITNPCDIVTHELALGLGLPKGRVFGTGTGLDTARLLSALARQTGIELVLWTGVCEVHEKFTAMEARHTRERFDAKIVAHPECAPEVLAEADFVGSTSAMGQWLAKEKPSRVAMITECSMADNLRNQFPQVEFIKPCNLCPHMKRITLPNIHACLRDLRHEVTVPANVAQRARKALERMLAVGRRDAV